MEFKPKTTASSFGVQADGNARAVPGGDRTSDLLRDRPAALRAGGTGALIGRLLALDDNGGTPLVAWPGRDAAVRARTAVDLSGDHVGRPVVLLFDDDDLSAPIVVGVIRGAGSADSGAISSVTIDADDRRVVVSAKNQLVLRCGASSITLTAAGKVIIEGAYIVSRASGTNRVQGGSVQLN